MVIKTTGTFQGKSNKLGEGGRAAQLKAQGVPGGIIGNLARKAGAAPGGPNYHQNEKKAGGTATPPPAKTPSSTVKMTSNAQTAPSAKKLNPVLTKAVF